MSRDDGWDDGEIDAFACSTADQSVTSEVRARAMRASDRDSVAQAASSDDGGDGMNPQRVERTSKIVTSVATLPEAWAFVMERAFIREGAWAQLRRITEPAVKAVLELHAMVDQTYGDPECAHCYADTEMGDHEDWPCETVTAIANAYGIEMP